MNGWAVAFIIIMTLRVGSALGRDGEPTEISSGVILFRTLVDAFILYMAGTFSG